MTTSPRDRLLAVVKASVAKANSELTIILSASGECFPLLDHGHPVRVLLGDVRGAAERLRWEMDGLLQMAHRS